MGPLSSFYLPLLQFCLLLSSGSLRSLARESTLVCMCSETQLYWTLCNPMDYSPPGSSVHGIFQARILEGDAIFSSRESSQSRDRTHIPYISCLEVLSPGCCLGPKQLLTYPASLFSWVPFPNQLGEISAYLPAPLPHPCSWHLLSPPGQIMWLDKCGLVPAQISPFWPCLYTRPDSGHIPAH